MGFIGESILRVLYPLNSEQIGGGNRSMLTLWLGLRNLGIQPTAVTPKSGPMSMACYEVKVSCHAAFFNQLSWRKPWMTSQALLQWKQFITTPPHEMIHSNGTFAARSVALAAWSTGRPHVCHVRFRANPDY